MLMPYRLRRWIVLAALASVAFYIALQPILASPDDCISLGEILNLLPYYVLLYFGTLPALIGVAVWRIAFARGMTGQRRCELNLTIAVLCVLLVLEVLAYLPSAYLTPANRCLDWMPLLVLTLWVFRRTVLRSGAPAR